MALGDTLNDATGSCVAKDYGFLMDWGDDMMKSSNALFAAIPAVTAALMASQI